MTIEEQLADLTKRHENLKANEARMREHYLAKFSDLLEACEKTISENLHLADGDNCTLIDLKRAIARAKG